MVLIPVNPGLSHTFPAFSSIPLGSLPSNYLAAHQPLLTDLTVIAGETVINPIGLTAPGTV